MVLKMTISMPEHLVSFLDGLVKRWDTTRSGAIAKLLEQAEKREMEDLMAEGYRELASERLRDAEFYFPAQAEVVLGEHQKG